MSGSRRWPGSRRHARSSSTTISFVPSSAVSPTSLVEPSPSAYAVAPRTSASNEARGEGDAGSMTRNQLRRTSVACRGDPSLKRRSGRKRKTTRRPSSSTRHDSASAGLSSSDSSNVVSVSNSCETIAELCASPVRAGSRSDGASRAMRTEPSAAPAGRPPQAPTNRQMSRRDTRRRIGRSIRAVPIWAL